MENDFRIKKNNAKDEVEFHKRKLTRLRHSWWWQLEQIYFNSDNDEDELELL